MAFAKFSLTRGNQKKDSDEITIAVDEDSEKDVFSEEEDDGDDEDSNDTDQQKNELPQPAYVPARRHVDEQFQGPAGSGGDRGKKNQARQVSRRPVSGVLVGV